MKPYISCGNRIYWYPHMKIAAKNYTDTNQFRDNEITTILTAIILLLEVNKIDKMLSSLTYKLLNIASAVDR